LTSAGVDDEVVPPTEDEAEEDDLMRESSLDISTNSIQPQKEAAASKPTNPLIPDPCASLKKHSRISELKTTKSVLKVLGKRTTDGVDPIESSDDSPLQDSASSAQSLTIAEQNVQNENLDKTVPTQSTPFPSKRVKDRLGVTISPTASSALFPLLGNEETPAPDVSSAMRPPPTPPWLSREERSMPKTDSKPRGSKKTQTRHSQNDPQPLEQSLAEWTTLPQTQSPLPIMSESSMVDELNSSPGDLPMDNVPTATVPPRHRKSFEAKGAPLFFPGTSQSRISDSQPADDGHRNEDASSSSDSDENLKKAGLQLRRSRSFSSSAPYRRLTDIASQGSVFASPLLTSAAPSPSVKRNEMENTFNFGRDESEDDDEEDNSSSDSDEQRKSHIPKSRRAGVKRGNKKGLFASI
jgi:hypothetical protein